MVLPCVVQSGRNFTEMGEAVIRVRYKKCRTVVTKTDTLQRFISWSIRRHEQFPVAVVIEMRADIERVWPLVNKLGSRFTEDLINGTVLMMINAREFILHFSLKLFVFLFLHLGGYLSFIWSSSSNLLIRMSSRIGHT